MGFGRRGGAASRAGRTRCDRQRAPTLHRCGRDLGSRKLSSASARGRSAARASMGRGVLGPRRATRALGSGVSLRIASCCRAAEAGRRGCELRNLWDCQHCAHPIDRAPRRQVGGLCPPPPASAARTGLRPQVEPNCCRARVGLGQSGSGATPALGVARFCWAAPPGPRVVQGWSGPRGVAARAASLPEVPLRRPAMRTRATTRAEAHHGWPSRSVGSSGRQSVRTQKSGRRRQA